jgi:O-antigen ligase
MKFFSRTYDNHSISCVLMILLGISVLVSPPLMNLFEALLVLVIVSSADLRQRLWATWQEPTVKFLLLFYAIILIGTIYSIAPPYVTFRMALGWHKLLLFPIAYSLFFDPEWKFSFLKALVGFLAICALISFGMWFFHIDVPSAPGEPGVFLRNHATQGMAFAVGALSAVVLALESVNSRFRRLFFACAVLLVANISLVTPGRSGYVVLLVSTVVAVVGHAFLGRRRFGVKEIFVALLLVAGVVGSLLLASASRERMALAVHEVETYDQAKDVTSMGIRMVFWKNTIEMIREQPLLGYGTGAFGTAYDRQVAGKTGVAATPAGDPHNQYMKITAENGVFALSAFVAFLVAVVRHRCPAPWRLLALAVLASWCTTSLFNSHFSTFNEGNFIYAWLGIMLASSPSPTVVAT